MCPQRICHHVESFLVTPIWLARFSNSGLGTNSIGDESESMISDFLSTRVGFFRPSKQFQIKFSSIAIDDCHSTSRIELDCNVELPDPVTALSWCVRYVQACQSWGSPFSLRKRSSAECLRMDGVGWLAIMWFVPFVRLKKHVWKACRRGGPLSSFIPA